MKKLMAAALAVCTMFSLGGCMMPESGSGSLGEVDEKEITFIQNEPIKDGQDIAVIDTTLGVIKMVLFTKEAPNTVAHFKKLVKDGFYDNQAIFLEGDVKAFISGASNDEGSEGKLLTDDGKKIEAEITQNLWHFSGAVSAWGAQKNRFSKTIVSDSRFFIVGDIPAQTELITQMEEAEYPQTVIDQYKEKGGIPQYTGSFTVFGQVYEGMEVVDEIVSMINGEALHTLGDTKINSIKLDNYKE